MSDNRPLTPLCQVGYKYWHGQFLVRVMAIAENHAMVRPAKEFPYVVTCEELWQSHMFSHRGKEGWHLPSGDILPYPTEGAQYQTPTGTVITVREIVENGFTSEEFGRAVWDYEDMISGGQQGPYLTPIPTDSDAAVKPTATLPIHSSATDSIISRLVAHIAKLETQLAARPHVALFEDIDIGDYFRFRPHDDIYRKEDSGEARRDQDGQVCKVTDKSLVIREAPPNG